MSKDPQKNKEAARRAKEKRRAFLADAKSHPCMDCGGIFPTCCMDFDHVRGEKKFNVGNMVYNNGIAGMKREIAKCDLVCSNCHRIRTQKRRERT